MENVSELESVIRKEFDRCDVVSEGLLRCERRHNDVAISVNFFDTTGNIPASREELANYLDTNIAERFYASVPQDLRWNHYLVFIHDSNANIPSRKVIEEDQNYARKFLVDRASLPEFLKGYKPSEADGLSEDDTFSRWAKALDAAGLDAIVDDQPRATLVHEYLLADAEALTTVRPIVAGKTHREDAIYASQLEQLQVRSFLPFPPPRTYDFGSVNLITGPNGVGKTSLLEAVEHFYCGATLRGELQQVRGADLLARFKGVDNLVMPETETENFRNRDLRWYGRNYDRKNKLAESFNRYNFYNSDAAYNFAIGPGGENLKESLSRLALGDEANKLWDRVQKTLKLFEDEKRILGNQLNVLKDTEMTLRRDFEQASKPSAVVDSLFGRLQQHLTQLRWSKVPRAIDEIDAAFTQAFQMVSEIVQQTSRLSWVSGDLTRKVLEEEYSGRKKALAELGEKRKSIHESKALLAKLDSEYRELANRRQEMTLLKQYLDIEFDSLVKMARELQETPTQIRAGFHVDPILAGTPTGLADHKSVASLENELGLRRRLLLEKKVALATQVNEMKDRLGNRESLLASIRSMALQLLEMERDRLSCPVCHTKFESYQALQAHVNEPEAESNVQGLQELIVQQQTNEFDMDVFEHQREFLAHCKEFLEATGEADPSCSITQVKAIASGLRLRLEDRRRERVALEEKLETLALQGLSEDAFKALIGSFAIGIGVERIDAIDLKVMLPERIANAERSINENQGTVGNERKRLEDLQREWSNQVDDWSPGESDEDVLNDLDSKLSAVTTLLGGLKSIEPYLEFGSNEDLREVFLRVQIADDALKAFSEAESAEKNRNTRLTELQTAKVASDAKIKVARDRLARSVRAIDALEQIVKVDNRDKAVEVFLGRHRLEISEIFRRIHAPREFLSLSSDGDALICLDGKTPRNFTQISTGQRSAVALSVFLTLNGMLKKAPRILIFDDPVTAVDDLNVLAFLDHLRDLVLRSRRQVFFSTANQKLATIFAKKFSFLGDSAFKHFPLSRP